MDHPNPKESRSSPLEWLLLRRGSDRWHPAMLLAGSAITGMALAPLFPLILALFLTEIGESRNVGWVFAVAGFGGGVCSWLTGMVSSEAGSLRMGLAVPGAAAVVMGLMASLRRRPLET